MNKAKKYKLKLDYTAEELEELKELSKTYDSAMNAVWGVVGAAYSSGPVGDLQKKYIMLDNHKDFDFMADINNVVMGTAIFPEKKYYVKLIKNSDFSYLYRSKLTNFLILDGCSLSQDYQTEFTEQEIKAIDPRYKAFAITL